VESDLLETPFDSLLIDDLLPREPVSIGQLWEIPADITAGLLKDLNKDAPAESAPAEEEAPVEETPAPAPAPVEE
jgi:hypothetical protein